MYIYCVHDPTCTRHNTIPHIFYKQIKYIMVKLGEVKLSQYLFKINITSYPLHNFILTVTNVWISTTNTMLKVTIFAVHLKFYSCTRIMMNLIYYANDNAWVSPLVHVNNLWHWVISMPVLEILEIGTLPSELDYYTTVLIYLANIWQLSLIILSLIGVWT